MQSNLSAVRPPGASSDVREYVNMSMSALRLDALPSFLMSTDLLMGDDFSDMVLYGESIDFGACCFCGDSRSIEDGETSVEQRPQTNFCTSQRVLVGYLYLQAIEVANRSQARLRW